jgi:hypothetical protein
MPEAESVAKAARILRSAAVVCLVLALLPMFLTSVAFVGSIGNECVPGRANHTAGVELGALGIFWLVFCVPAAPATWLARPKTRRWPLYALSLALALLADLLSLVLLMMGALSHLC